MSAEKRELTLGQAKILATLIAEKYVELERERHKRFMSKVKYQLFTPLIIQWYHKLINKKPYENENL